jgi:hypothetical protein
MMEGSLVPEEYRAEFEADGVKQVRKKIAQGEYVGEKQDQAAKWVRQQQLQSRTFKSVKKQLSLARRTARDTRITLVLAAVILIITLLPWLRLLFNRLH